MHPLTLFIKIDGSCCIGFDTLGVRGWRYWNPRKKIWQATASKCWRKSVPRLLTTIKPNPATISKISYMSI